MKEFMNEDFLLDSPTARELYFDHAAQLPIYDYHCHISPKAIAQDHKSGSITELWLGGDHYKWRAMRSNGIDERCVTGKASDYEKFKAWAATVPKCLGNPLYHWTHLELQRYFGINELINETTADAIWERCNALVKQDDFSAQNLIRRSNVRVLATTEDPLDGLAYHRQIREDRAFEVLVSTAFRPDNAVEIGQAGFVGWVRRLEEVAGITISGSYERFLEALEMRVSFFHQNGCRISDHALDEVCYRRDSNGSIKEIFQKRMNGQQLTAEEAAVYKTEILLFFGRLYRKYDWSMQLHIGALRYNNTRMKGTLGFDSIGDGHFAQALSLFLDTLDREDQLPRTILYCLNPSGNEVLGTMIGNFQDGSYPGKIQFGSGWWFNDNEDGIIRQMVALANLGLLSRFVGMTTDSRSFISYPRHEYFRRILCNLLGGWVESGRAPHDLKLLGQMVKDICFNNAELYFGLKRVGQ
jgi:glucuronate isomerase